MRCSSFESKLDEYVDGTLSPKERARVAEHVATCTHCAELLAELRVVDALLLTHRKLDPAPNFTFKAMADVRSVPAPHVHRPVGFGVLAAYLAFAWAAIALFYLLRGDAARAALGLVVDTSRRAVDALSSLALASSHLFGGHSVAVTATVGGILALDFVVGAVAVALYTLVHPRLAAHLARTTETC